MTEYYIIDSGDNRAPAGAIRLARGSSLLTGEGDWREQFGDCSSLESDLLLIACSAFAADRATPRGERENICRFIRLSIPIVNVGRLVPLIDLIEEVLSRLSNDSWQIEFRQVDGSVEASTDRDPPSDAATLLFSGGLDSLAASIEFGEESGSLVLVSHRTHNAVTDRAQRDLAQILSNAGYRLPHWRFFVSSRSDVDLVDHDLENSQRTRSFLFLILGALVARRQRSKKLMFLAENGQLAIHLPLTQGRIGAFSTHTAHPEVLSQMEVILGRALGREIEIINPYVYRTKKEVVEVVHRRLPEALRIANSCWMNSRLGGGHSHCGQCIPCFVRRIAIESFVVDETAYARDPWTEDLANSSVDDDGKRNLVDLAEFIRRFEIGNNEELMSEWPELYAESLDASRVIDMYRRFAAEARVVLCRYPKIAALIS